MKKTLKLLLLPLAAALLLTACGEKDTETKKNGDDEDDTVPNINYEDYIEPVVDREVADLITAEELSVLMSVDVAPVIITDSVVTYQSENGYYVVTIVLENQTRALFDTLSEDVDVWTPLTGVGEAAYWSVSQTELVAYQDGYAVSVSGYHVIPGCLQSIMLRVLKGLQQ